MTSPSLTSQTSTETRIMTDGNRSVLLISRMSRDLIGDVTCRAENVAGSVTCTATLSLLPDQDVTEVMESPRFTRTPEHAKVMDGQAVLFTAQVNFEMFYGFTCPFNNYRGNFTFVCLKKKSF